jgi:hypothetical protein
MATAPSPNDLTRQQLDELDALLQRMLSVPMPTDTPPPSASARANFESAPALADPPLPPSWRVDPPAAPRPTSFPASPDPLPPPPLIFPEPPSSVSLRLEASTEAPPATAPVPPAPKQAPKTSAPVSKMTPAPAIAPPPLPKPTTVPAPKATGGLTPAPTAPPVPFLFLPLVAFNTLFDTVCGLFGPLGRVLRSGFFKHLYGLAGLLLLLYTAAHVAQVLKWVTLPVTLPWPD